MRNTFLLPFLLLFVCPSQSATGAVSNSNNSYIHLNENTSVGVSAKKLKKRQKWQKRLDKFNKKLEKKRARAERKGKSIKEVGLGILGLLIMLVGGMFIVLGLIIPVVGIFFLVLGIIIAFAGLISVVVLEGVGSVDVN